MHLEKIAQDFWNLQKQICNRKRGQSKYCTRLMKHLYFISEAEHGDQEL